MEAWREELYHHGILGQKWGRRNGPPYPLGSGDHSASEKKAGWRKSLGKDNSDDEPYTGKKLARLVNKNAQLAKQKIGEHYSNDAEYRRLQKQQQPIKDIYKQYEKEQDKYINDAVDNYLKNSKSEFSKDEIDAIRWCYKYDDADQGVSMAFFLVDKGYDVPALFTKSNALDNKIMKCKVRLNKELAGDYRTEVVKPKGEYNGRKSQTLYQFVVNNAPDGGYFDGVYQVNEGLYRLTNENYKEIQSYYSNNKKR